MLFHVAVTGSQSGESLKMEMSQEGFSAAYVPGVIKKHTDTHVFVSAFVG